MTQPRGPAIVQFCLVFCLAIALAAIGLAILFDFATREVSANGRILLAPGGGVAAMLLSASLLFLLFRKTRSATIVSGATIVVAFGQVMLTHFNATKSLEGFSLSPALAFVVILTAVTVVASASPKYGRIIGLATGPFVMAAGLFSLLSYWLQPLQITSLGTLPESTIIVSPLVILIGLSLPLLSTIGHRDKPDISHGLILVGTMAIFLTIGLWHNMRIQNSQNLQSRAEILANQLKNSVKAAFSDDLALIDRLARRQQLLGGLPDEKIWPQEVQSYLEDFHYISLIAKLDSQHRPFAAHSNQYDYRQRLDSFLQAPETTDWLEHVRNSARTRVSAPWPDKSGQDFVVIASPVTTPGESWFVIALVDLEEVLSGLIQFHDDELGARIYHDTRLVHDFAPPDQKGSAIPLVSHRLDRNRDTGWRVESYFRQGSLSGSALYLPPLVLFTGLTLSFLLMLTHLFWRESERRTRSLQQLNTTVNAHLNREQSLRYLNERIMAFSRDILCSLDAKGRFLSVNPASQDILGYRPEELIGKSYQFLLPPEDREATADNMAEVIAGGRRLSDGFRNHLIHRDGHLVTLSWTADWSDEDQALFCVGRDLSDQLAAETLMRERDQFFSLSPDMFCIVDLNSHFFEVNNAFEQALGYNRDELLGASYLQLIHVEDRPRVEEAVAKLADGENISDLHIRAISKNNSQRWLELSATLSSDELIYVAARDTTEIRTTQQKLRESERLLQIAERSAGIGGWALNLATDEVRWSRAIFDIHEMPHEEAPNLEEAIGFYTEQSREILSRVIETCIEAGIPFDEELQIRTRAGNLRWVRAIGQAVKNDEGRIVQIQGALQDITASHQALEQIRRFAERQSTIFESITDAFFTVNHDWQFTYVNQRSEELLGHTREELLGNSLWEVFPAALESEFGKQYRHAVATGESVSFESCYEPLNDWFEVSAYPSDEGLAVYYRSIKERKQAQAQLEHTMAELERSNRELQDFAFVASHDLQEPLRKIQAFSDRLLGHSDRFNEQEQDYLQRMQSAAKRMQSLIQDLLSYSRITTRAQPLIACDTDQILAEVLQDMETMVSKEGAEITTEPLPKITGDATQIRQVFQNLLSNAIKFHHKNQRPEVKVHAENSTEDGWTLVVSDNGVGFEQRYAEKMFHPFQRLHQREFPGTGIGMAIVKKILDRHGAKVTVRSGVDQGTTFHIYFPTGNQLKVDPHG